jgi:hypothetical protein
MASTIVYSYLAIVPLFLALGVFIVVKSRRSKLFNFTWTGLVLVLYAFMMLGIVLNSFGILVGIWNLVLQSANFGTTFCTLKFTREMFYKYKSKRFLTIITASIVVMAAICIPISLFGDTSLPYADIYDEWDSLRYFITNIIAIPVSIIPLLVSSWHEYKKARNTDPALSRRFLLYFTSLLAAIASPVSKEIGNRVNALYGITVVLVIFTSIYYLITLYIVWLAPAKRTKEKIVVNATDAFEAGGLPPRGKFVTSVAIYNIIEDLGAVLSESTGKPVKACSGLLLLTIEKELGPESMSCLNLAQLVPVFEGPLQKKLSLLGLPNPGAATSALKARFSDQYAAYSLGLF